MAASLIPERTIDGWISIVIAGIDPLARIWAPTPRAQARSQPWDHAVETCGPAAKLIVTESKALMDDSALRARRPHVSIDLEQLRVLVGLEQLHGLPAHYTLPSLRVRDLLGAPGVGPLYWADQRLSPRQVGEWIRVPTATELAMLPGVRDAIRKGQASHLIRADEIYAQNWPDLVDFVARVRRCERGRLVSAAVPFGPIAPGLLTGDGRARLVETARHLILDEADESAEAEETGSPKPFGGDDTRHGRPQRTALDRTIWSLLSIADS